MLEALRLPKDMRNVPSNAERNATAICQLVAQVKHLQQSFNYINGTSLQVILTLIVFIFQLGVHAARAHEQTLGGMHRIYNLKIEKQTLEEDLRKAQEENIQLEASLREAQDAARQKEDLAAELRQSNLVIKRLVAEQKADKSLLPSLLDKAETKGYKRASEEIEEQLPGILKDALARGERSGILNTHRESFTRGFLAGLDAAKVAADDSLRGSVDVPEVVLPDHLINLPPTPGVTESGEKENAEEGESEAVTSSLKSAEDEVLADPPILEKSTEGSPPVVATEGKDGQQHL